MELPNVEPETVPFPAPLEESIPMELYMRCMAPSEPVAEEQSESQELEGEVRPYSDYMCV